MKDVRYLMVDGEKNIHAAYPPNTRGQWDFSVPPYKGRGFRLIDLDALPEDLLGFWQDKLSEYKETL
jgi:hypothetical protein